MYFKQLHVGGYDKNLSYLVGDEETREVMVVDPDNQKMIDEVIEKDDLKLVGVIITHEHHDHVAGTPAVVAKYGVPVYVHGLARYAVEDFCGDVCEVTIREVSDGDEIKIGEVAVKVLHTPGHAHGAVCLLVEPQNGKGAAKMMTGDTLFVGGCGRCDLATSDIDKMYESLFVKLAQVGDEVEIYPGHDYGDRPFSTMGEERKSNRFLSCGSKEEFVEGRMG